MNPRKRISSFIKKINGSEKIKEANDHIARQSERIKELEDRNAEWVREVRQMRHQDDRMNILWPVFKKDLIKADFSNDRHESKRLVKTSSEHSNTLIVSWIIPPMGPVSGGHTTILRTIQGLESNGFKCRLYIYDPLLTSSFEVISENMKSYPQVKAELKYNEPIERCDAIFATSWHTAYPVYNCDVTDKKFYFVQDFEPMFDPAGTYSTLAENTYKMNLHGITLGSWMKDKLKDDYGMHCDNFDLRVDNDEYKLSNVKPRKKIVFYARPVTPRRGFELGILSLEEFHRKHPEYEINLIGWDVSQYDIGFKYINHGIVDSQKLNELYNECAAGLVLSFTNMSLLPIEMMSAGCIPVVNDAICTRTVGYSKYVQYTSPDPTSIAESLYGAIKLSEDRSVINKISDYAKKFSWNDYNMQIAKIIKDNVRQK